MDLEDEENFILHEAILKGDDGEVAKLLDEDYTRLKARIEGCMPLTVAAASGQLGVARLLVQRGANVNEVGPGGKTALHWAAKGGHQEVVAFLLSKNARADHADNLGNTPLMWGCEGSHAGVVRMLVHYMGRQGKEAGIQAATIALHWAAREGDAQMAKFLLGKGAQAGNGSAEYQVTALMEACSKGRLNVVRLLVQHRRGQGLEDKDRKGCTALYHAARGGHEDVVTFLLSKGAQATSRSARDCTVLMGAAKHGHLGVMRLLVEHTGDAGLEERDVERRTALSHAAERGHKEVVGFLLSKGVQANSTDLQKETNLMLAAGMGHLGVVQLLVQHIGEQGLEEKDFLGRTALHHATSLGREKVVAYLVGKGAQATQEVLVAAVQSGHLKVVRFLVQHLGGRCLGERDRDGRTALHWAAESLQRHVMRFLLLAGADPTIKDHEGRTPRVLLQERKAVGGFFRDRGEEKESCLTVFQWWEGELERGYVLYRTARLHKAYTTQRDQPTSKVPAYLQARVAAGQSLPVVEVVVPQRQPYRPGIAPPSMSAVSSSGPAGLWPLDDSLLDGSDWPLPVPSSSSVLRSGPATAGSAIPTVPSLGSGGTTDVMPTQTLAHPEEEKEQAGAGGKRNAVGEPGDQQGGEVGWDEVYAMLKYVMTAMNEELVTELLEGFHQ